MENWLKKIDEWVAKGDNRKICHVSGYAVTAYRVRSRIIVTQTLSQMNAL